MTPRERRERAKRKAQRGPIYEGIGFIVIVMIATLIAGPVGLIFMAIVGVMLFGLGIAVGIMRGPGEPPPNPEVLPPA